MKKIFLLISMIVLIFSFSSVNAAFNHIEVSNQNVTIDGIKKDFEIYNIDGNNYFKLRDIAYVLNGTGSQFSVNFNSEKNLIEIEKGKAYTSVGGEMTLRADKSKTAQESTQKILIDNTTKELKAFNIGDNNFFKLRDLGTELGFNVDFDSANDRLLVASAKKEQTANITDVVAKIYNGIMYVQIDTDAPMTKYNLFTMSDPERIILDISNSNFKVEKNEIEVNYNGLSKIRLGNQGDSVNRIVLDVNNIGEYKIEQSKDMKTTYLALSKSFELADALSNPNKNLYVYNGTIMGLPDDENKIEQSGEQLKPNENNSIEENNNKNEENNETVELTGKEAKISNITYSSDSNKLKITADKKITAKTSTLQDPYRIIIDVDNSILVNDGPKTIHPNNKNVTEIRFSQKEVNVVRIVFELKNEIKYSVSEKSKSIEVTLEDYIPEDVQYEVTKDYALITLYNVDEDIFSAVESVSTNKYTLKYDTTDFNPKKETKDINDSFVESIDIKSGKIIIYGVNNVTFSIDQDGNNVIIKVFNKTSNSNTNSNKNGGFIVLLDAGHGGSDPGACNGDYHEKDYNLAIMLKLMKLLEDTDGITVYASRTTDEYIDRQGRLDFANAHKDADLFVSVHNNSMANKNYSGTMVLYYDNEYDRDFGITSKEFAKIVSDKLVGALNTRNWGTVSRDDLWVLYYSSIPSILCEVSFVSNDEEVQRLATEEFQETAARAIYDGIMQAKKQMGK